MSRDNSLEKAVCQDKNIHLKSELQRQIGKVSFSGTTERVAQAEIT